MGAKIKDNGNGVLSFYCPCCGHNHVYYTQKIQGVNAVWSFNGNFESPTFEPSLLNRWGKEVDPNYDGPMPSGRCHLYVRNGKIEYCGDCSHEFKGRTVDMKDINLAG